MYQITGNLVNWVAYFLLVMTRMSALFVISPVFGRANLSGVAKAGLSLLMSMILVNLTPPGSFEMPGLWEYALMILTEAIVGLCIGYMTTMFFSIVFVAGQIMDMRIGFGMVQVFDVQANAQVPIVGSLFNIVILISFLASNGHIRLIQILFRTFEYIPAGHASFDPNVAMVVVEAFCRYFLLAIAVAMPITAAGLLAEISLGIMVRTAPQMNVFVVGLPVKIIIGLLMLVLIVPMFVSMTGIVFDTMFAYIDRLFEGVVPI